MMAAAAALTKVTAAQNSYDTELVIANRRKSPSEGGNVNKRQLEAALTKMKARWTELYTAKDDYFNKFNFTDRNAKDQELIVWAEKADVHDDWAE